MKKNAPQPNQPSLFSLLKPYTKLLIPLVIVTLLANALTLWLPRLLSHGIDTFLVQRSITNIIWEFSIASVFIFLLTYLQSIVQTYASEKVALDLRKKLSEKISTQTFAQVQALTPAKLLTNLTSDIDSVKNFVAQAIVSIKLKHRTSIGRLNSVVDSLLAEIEILNKDKSVENLPMRVDLTKKLSDTLKTSIDKERQAFGIQDKTVEQKPTQQMTDEEIERRISDIYSKS
jgi:ABC-type multidrug transport system fused ATPase/permease subunit